jgi:hypothetical protein
MRTLTAALVATAAFAIPTTARAQFEGRLEYKMSKMPGAEEGGGTAVLWLGSGGARSEFSMNVKVKDQAQHEVHMVSLWRKAEPGRTYIISEEKKAYSVIEMSKNEGRRDDEWKVEKLGSATVAGYSCERARLTRGSNNGQMEVCVTQKLGKLPFSMFQHLRIDDTLPSVLAKAGLDGIPVRWSGRPREDGKEFEIELTAAHRESVPASRFEIPAGYQQTGMGSMVLSPEQAQRMSEARKRMEEKMKNMTPEQRQQIEEMMKRNGMTPPDK